MPHASGMKQSIRLAKEASLKTLPATVHAGKIPAIQPNFGLGRNKFQSSALTGSPQPRPIALGKKWVDFDFRVEASPLSLVDPLEALFGSVELSGTPALQQRLYYLGDQSTWGVEQAHTDLTLFPRWLGLMFGAGSFAIETDGLCEVGFAGVGCRQVTPTPAATMVNGTLRDRTSLLPFGYLFVRIRRGGTVLGYSKTMAFDVNRQVGYDFTQDETDEPSAVFTQVASIVGRMKARFENRDLLDESAVGDETSLDFFLPAGNGLALFGSFPTVRFTPFKITSNGTGILDVDGGFDAYARGSASQFAGQLRSEWFTAKGTLPTTTLVIKLNGGAGITVTFQAGDTTPEAVVARINGAAGLAGVASVERMAGEVGGVVVLKASTNGAGGSIQVDASSTGDLILGFDNLVHTGLDNVALVLGLLNQAAV